MADLTPDFDLEQIKSLFPKRPLFVKVWGSFSHNTSLPASDVDYLAVYAAPTSEVLSLDKPPETVTNSKPDLEAHEVEKFCRLLIKGNPSMIEMLWTERMCWTTPEWTALRNIRAQFLSSQAVLQYVGYARGQEARFKGGGRPHTGGGKYNTK